LWWRYVLELWNWKGGQDGLGFGSQLLLAGPLMRISMRTCWILNWAWKYVWAIEDYLKSVVYSEIRVNRDIWSLMSSFIVLPQLTMANKREEYRCVTASPFRAIFWHQAMTISTVTVLSLNFLILSLENNCRFQWRSCRHWGSRGWCRKRSRKLAADYCLVFVGSWVFLTGLILKSGFMVLKNLVKKLRNRQ